MTSRLRPFLSARWVQCPLGVPKVLVELIERERLRSGRGGGEVVWLWGCAEAEVEGAVVERFSVAVWWWTGFASTVMMIHGFRLERKRSRSTSGNEG